MTKAQEIQDAKEKLAFIDTFVPYFLNDVGGTITPETKRGLVEIANWCHVALGHPTPYTKAKIQVQSLIINAKAAKNTQNQA